MSQAPANQPVPDTQLNEALISMMALTFIEENRLLANEQLEDAKNSLQALFLRTSGEETMLRKLIETLKTTKALNQAFSNIAKILSGIHRSADTIDMKINKLREFMDEIGISPEENTNFVGPFMGYMQAFMEKIRTINAYMEEYLLLKENEGRQANQFRIALNARANLRQRLSGKLGSEAKGEMESKIMAEVMQTFDYGETEKNLTYARNEATAMENEIEELLAQLEDICQMVMKPAMRKKSEHKTTLIAPEKQDVFKMLSAALRAFPRLYNIKEPVLELFKLCQHSYGMFRLDLQNLNKALEPMINNAEAYFTAKEEDKGIKTKREKLEKIEGLIYFLERTAVMVVSEKELVNYNKFSRRLSQLVSEKRSKWDHICEDLLRIKVMAEAELSTRI
jgi:hypothetical protein